MSDDNGRGADAPVPEHHDVHPDATALDTQVGGIHYLKWAIQPVDFIVKNDIPYREANVIKYVMRHRDKNGAQDLRKARHYIDMLLEEYPDAY